MGVFFFSFGNALQMRKTLCFLFHQGGAICTFLSTILETSMFPWSELQSCFPPKKVFSEVRTCFHLDISACCILKENIDTIKVWKHGKPSYWIPQCISFQSRTQTTITCKKNTLYFLLDVFEAFVFRDSLFALTLLALFGIFIGVTLLIKTTSGKKPTCFGQFSLVFNEWTTAKFEHCTLKWRWSDPKQLLPMWNSSEILNQAPTFQCYYKI